MRFRGATATAVLALALALTGCIYPEPINEVPTPVDSAPTIQQAFPTTHQVPLLPPLASNPEQDCYVDVGLDSVLSPPSVASAPTPPIWSAKPHTQKPRTPIA